MALEIWYDQEPENDFGPGDPAIVIAEVEDLDAFVDRVLRESAGHVVPPMIQVSVAGHPELGVLEAGLGPERGFVNLLSGDGGISSGDPSRGGLVLYGYMGTTSEVDATAEIPLEAVRQGLREFLVGDGRKPESLRWQDA
jgi:hypothetical protein